MQLNDQPAPARPHSACEYLASSPKLSPERLRHNGDEEQPDLIGTIAQLANMISFLAWKPRSHLVFPCCCAGAVDGRPTPQRTIVTRWFQHRVDCAWSGTVHEYDLIAEWYASKRVDETGVPEANALALSIPPGSLVLDSGCGNGVPITRSLLSAGCRVVGLDSSSAMLARFTQNCPDASAVRGLMQCSPFADAIFDAAIAWGVMFHLAPQDATRAIASVSRVVKAGAPFLFTSGDADKFQGKKDTMNGVTFTYFSYSRGSYRRILREHGFTLIDVHTDSGNNTYYLAKKQ